MKRVELGEDAIVFASERLRGAYVDGLGEDLYGRVLECRPTATSSGADDRPGLWKPFKAMIGYNRQ